MIDLTLRMTRRNIRSLEDEEETCDVRYYCIISVLRGYYFSALNGNVARLLPTL